MLALSLVVLAAAPPPPLADGIDLYERGLYEKSRAALSKVLDSPAPQADQNRARLYLAADYFALGDRRGALYALEDLARKAPEQQLDASVFPPEFLQLWKQARENVAKDKPESAPQVVVIEQPPPAPPPQVAVESPPSPSPSPSRRKLFALVPTAAAIALGSFSLYSGLHAQALYGQLTGPTPPPTLTEGQQVADQGRAANRDLLIGTLGAVVTAALAVALALLL